MSKLSGFAGAVNGSTNSPAVVKANKALEDAYRADEDLDIFLKEVKFLKVNENLEEELEENNSDLDSLVNIDDIDDEIDRDN